MKKIIFAILGLLSLSSFAQKECSFKVVDSTGVTIVVPVYNSKVLYYFDDFGKKAMAQVQWAFDESATSLCMKEYEAVHPQAKILLPEVDFPSLDVEVSQGLKRVSLSIVPGPGGRFHGQTDFVPVNYRSKAELIKAIKEKKDLITIHGKLSFQYEVLKNDRVAEFDCVKDGQKSGVMALHGRLSDLILKINSFKTGDKVNRDVVLEDFMGACVELKEEESINLTGLARRVKLLKGKIPVYGMVKGYQKGSTKAFQISESSYIEF